VIASIRPTDWNWLLLGHVASAMILVGGLMVVTLAALAARRKAQAAPLLQAIAFWVNLTLVIPAFIAVHIFGGILSDREYDDHTPNWLDTGFAVTTVATIVAIVLAILQFWVLRRARAGRPGGWQAALTASLGPLLLAAMVAVIVLMAGKPS
jgi:hypothetical protein